MSSSILIRPRPAGPFARSRRSVAGLLALLALSLAPQAQGQFANGQAASLVVGKTCFTYGYVNSPCVTAGDLALPGAVAVSPSTGKVYVADTQNYRVLRYASAAAWTNGQPAERVFGQADFASNRPNRGTQVSASTLSAPYGLAVDAAGRLYVADTENHRVLRFDGADTQATNGPNADRVFGQADVTGSSENRALGTSANTLKTPRGLAVDAAGRLYVADLDNNRVLRFDGASTQATNGPDADRVFGQTDFAGNGGNPWGSGQANTLSAPNDVAVDAAGRLYVADAGNNRVLRFDGASTQPTNGPNATRVFGQADFVSAYPGTSQANTLFFPQGVAADAAGRLYVADYINNRVLRFDGAGTQATNGPNADRVFGQANVTGSSANRALGTSANTLSGPSDVAVDASGRLYVADTGNNRVLRFGGAGTQPTNGPDADGVLGQTDLSGMAPNHTKADEAALSRPTSVTVSPSTGKVYVADTGNSRVLRYASAAAWMNGQPAERVFGQADFASTDPNRAPLNGSPRANTLATPHGVAVDPSGRLYVADTGNNRVLRFDAPDTQTLNGPDATVVIGQPDFTSLIPNGTNSYAGPNTLYNPSGLAFDTGGRLYVADTRNNRVLRFNGGAPGVSTSASRVFGQADFAELGSNRYGSAGANTLSSPRSVAIDAQGRLYVADMNNNRVLRFDGASAQAVNGADATRVFGQATFTDSQGNRGGSANAGTLAVPYGVAVAQGRLYVADTGNHRVLRFDAADTQLTNGPDADGVLGQPGFTSADPTVTATGLFGPRGLAVHPQSQRLLVVDSESSRLLAYNATSSLPVELTAFAATADGPASVRLTWSTASETRNAGFTVERALAASGARTWQSAAPFVPGRGTTSERADYSVTIDGLSPGRHAFRLRQTDLDGTTTAAGSVEVSVGAAGGLSLVVLSNATSSPVVRLVGASLSSGEAATVEVMDVLGRVVRREAVSASGEVAAAGLPSGVYVVRAVAGAHTATAPLVVR